MLIVLLFYHELYSIPLTFFLSSPGQHSQPYASLDEEETEKIKAILFIMDRFSISLEAYHELTQVQKSLPRTHHIESFAKVLDSQWGVKRTPGEAEGAELPLKFLLQHEIRQCVSSRCHSVLDLQTF